MKTTFKKIKKFNPCPDGWKKLIGYYKPENLNEVISIEEIIKSNGIKDAVWALRCVKDKKKILLFCADIAESVLHIYESNHPNDTRIKDCIAAIREFANNEISHKELKRFKAAAADAAAYAADAAAYAAYAADAAYAAAAAADAAAYAAYAAYAAADAADAAAYAAYAAYAAADARQNKWGGIKEMLLKYIK